METIENIVAGKKLRLTVEYNFPNLSKPTLQALKLKWGLLGKVKYWNAAQVETWFHSKGLMELYSFRYDHKPDVWLDAEARRLAKQEAMGKLADEAASLGGTLPENVGLNEAVSFVESLKADKVLSDEADAGKRWIEKIHRLPDSPLGGYQKVEKGFRHRKRVEVERHITLVDGHRVYWEVAKFEPMHNSSDQTANPRVRVFSGKPMPSNKPSFTAKGVGAEEGLRLAMEFIGK